MFQESQQIEIMASPKKCYDVICNFSQYSQWQKNIENVQILDYQDGRPLVVEYQVNAIIKTIRYTLHYEYDEQNLQKMKIEWRYVGGDVKNIEGSYTFEAIDNNKTRITYSLVLELGFGVPTFLFNRMKTASMREILESLKSYVEKNN